jgi:hypothetical protein
VKYPANIVLDSGWARIHEGNGLPVDRYFLRRKPSTSAQTAVSSPTGRCSGPGKMNLQASPAGSFTRVAVQCSAGAASARPSKSVNWHRGPGSGS